MNATRPCSSNETFQDLLQVSSPLNMLAVARLAILRVQLRRHQEKSAQRDAHQDCFHSACIS